MLIFDAHCHLDAITNNNEYLSRALVSSVNLNDISKLLQLRYNNKFYKVGFGIHPWFIDSKVRPEDLINELLAQCIKNSPDFIGEIGLDKLKPSFTYQVELFKLQLEIAVKFKLPVVVHCVKAYNEVLQLIKQYKVTGVIHGFNANYKIAQQFIEAGFLIGVGSLVIKNSQIRRDIAKIPLTNIVFETDAPYMPLFNKVRSQLSDIFLYAQTAASQYNLNLIDVIHQVNNNMEQLFRN